MTNSEIADILTEIAVLIRQGGGEYLRDDVLGLCAIYVGYKFPRKALEGMFRRRFDEHIADVWAAYLLIANQSRARDGRLIDSAGKPRTVEYIANKCSTTTEEILKAEKEFIKGGRLKIEADGTRLIVSWGKYR